MRGLMVRLLVLTLGVALFAAPAAATTGGFEGPLFGLTNGSHRGLLVADSSSGIHSITRGTSALVVPLPGVLDMSAIGRRSMWATASDEGGAGLYRIIKGEPTLVADLSAFELTHNPDGAEEPESNPYDVESLGWNAAVVADAAANDLLKVTKHGKIKVVAVFGSELVSTDHLKALAGCPEPPIADFEEFCALPEVMPAEAVPTSLAIGPDGYYYVGELKGFPAPTGMSNIWRVSPHAKDAACPSRDCVKVFDGGFTSIIDLTFGPDGKLYVAELDEATWAAVEIFGAGDGGTISKCDLRTHHCREVATGIPMLTAIAFDHHGSLWATQNSLIPGAAEVIRIK